MTNQLNKRLLGVGVVIYKEGKILVGLQHRDYEDTCWATPGGKVSDGVIETIEARARREVLEETGIEIKNIEPLTFYEDVENGAHIISF